MIGVFDSGIGGLTTVKSILDRIPHADILYFGDTARTPYGSKSSETIRNYAVENVNFLLDKGAKLIIMACNSASSAATEVLKEKFDVPIFEVITPAVELATKTTKNFGVGLIGTRATVLSGVYEKKLKEISTDIRVYSNPAPLLVPLIEEGWLNSRETNMIVKKYLLPLKQKQIDTLILGCTHYPILKETIKRKMGKNVRIIDSSTAIADSVENFLKSRDDRDILTGKDARRDIYVSDITSRFGELAVNILKQKIILKHI